MKFSEHYFKEEISSMIKEVTLIIEEESASIEIDKTFISRLSNYLEKKFPAYGDFDVAIGNEIRKFMKGDNSYVLKVKTRIHDIINKGKAKFLHDIVNKTGKIKVQPKDTIQNTPNNNPLLYPNPPISQGELPPNV